MRPGPFGILGWATLGWQTLDGFCTHALPLHCLPASSSGLSCAAWLNVCSSGIWGFTPLRDLCLCNRVFLMLFLEPFSGLVMCGLVLGLGHGWTVTHGSWSAGTWGAFTLIWAFSWINSCRLKRIFFKHYICWLVKCLHYPPFIWTLFSLTRLFLQPAESCYNVSWWGCICLYSCVNCAPWAVYSHLCVLFMFYRTGAHIHDSQCCTTEVLQCTD